MSIVQSIQSEYLRYKVLAEKALAQVEEPDFVAAPAGGNSMATIVWHMSGNLASRFTDFLTTDGEKPWRNRDAEFEARSVTRPVLLETWEAGWRVLFATLETLGDDQLQQTVVIRGQPLTVIEALLRSLAHASHHVGQIVYLAKTARGDAWTSLSIPKGGSAAYNARPTLEEPPGAQPPGSGATAPRPGTGPARVGRRPTSPGLWSAPSDT